MGQAVNSHAQDTSGEFIYQEQQEEALKKRIIPTPSVHMPANSLPEFEATTTTVESSEDAPCFTINELAFEVLPEDDTLKPFDGILKDLHKTAFKPACMNIHDIQKLAGTLQNRLIDKGFVTTRVVVPDQDLSLGKLTLGIVVGRVGDILSDTKDSTVSVFEHKGLPLNFKTALPLKSGDVLNIRALETALENFKRVPSSQANFELLPAGNNKMGQSDILIHYSQDRRLRTSLLLDDAGSKNTGKYQANVTVSLDNPLSLNDLLYLSYGYSFGGLSGFKDKLQHSLGSDKRIHHKDSNSYSFGYVLPIDRHVFSWSSSHFNYNQTIAGFNKDYVYSGESDNHSLTSSHLIHRNQRSKTYIDLGGFTKKQKNLIDDFEIGVQRRKTAGWTAGIRHETALGKTLANVGLSYQKGTGAFDALVPAEALFGEGDNRVGIIKAEAGVYHPFNDKLSYEGSLKGQYAESLLVPGDRMSIGTRYSIRGFDGERTLAADHGVLLKNTLNYTLFHDTRSRHIAYWGLDAGRVRMEHKAQDELLLGHSLVGSVIGIKGQINQKAYQSINYDVFAGRAIHAPKGFFGREDDKDKKADWVYGFSLGVGF